MPDDRLIEKETGQRIERPDSTAGVNLYPVPGGSNSRSIEAGDTKDTPTDHVTGWTDVLTVHINEYLRYYRMVPWVLGSVGVVLFLRYSRTPIARFRQVADIPVEFVVDNRKVSGVVKATGWNTLGVWHVPAWRWALRWGTRPPSECSVDELLTVQFSGVVFSNPSHSSTWLKQNLLGKRVWLTFLDHTSRTALDQKAVQCIVESRRKGLLRWRKFSVNEHLLREGVGAFDEVTGVAKRADYTKIVSGLTRTERVAKTRGKGVWQGTEHVTTWNRLKNYFRKTRNK